MSTTGNTGLMAARTIAALVVAVLIGLLLAAQPAHASLFYTVNETGDEADANPGDGLCDVQHESEGVNIFSSSGNEVLGNLVGTKKDGTSALGNGEQGVDLFNASNNFIGDGTAAGANTIAFNVQQGIRVRAAAPGVARGDHFSRNSIFSNGGIGIDLEGGVENAAGATKNDPGDADFGPNDLQNKPVVTSAKSGRGTTIKGNLNSNPNVLFTIQFFSSPKGETEGKTFLGQRSVSTDGSGKAPFSFQFKKKVAAGQNVTATATKNFTGDTSEFSAAKGEVAG